MNRRGFLLGCLAAAAAPAIVRADSLMRVIPRDLVVFPPCTESTGAYLQHLREINSEIQDCYTVVVSPDDFRGLTDPRAAKRWAALLQADITRRVLMVGEIGKWG